MNRFGNEEIEAVKNVIENGKYLSGFTTHFRGGDEVQKFEEEFEGFAARICQHETDHLDGMIFFDRMDDLKTLTFGQEYHRFWAKKEEPEGED